MRIRKFIIQFEMTGDPRALQDVVDAYNATRCEAVIDAIEQEIDQSWCDGEFYRAINNSIRSNIGTWLQDPPEQKS